ncbi:MAG: membrane protein insertase YidC, partial [Cytophagales bacterium]|nr:membrane protein insertase YidC [Cytophagales bacterium]
MDKKQTVGILIIGLMFLGLNYFLPKPEPAQEPVAQEQTAASAEPEISKPVVSDSLQRALNQQVYGVFAEAASGTEQAYTLENEDVIVTFSNKGALIERVELKKYNTWDKRPVVLMDKENSSFGYNLITVNGNIDFANLYFQSQAPLHTSVSQGEKSISFKLEVQPGRFVEQVYTLP